MRARSSVLVATALAATLPALASAQTRQTDPRWQPWIGCWTAASNAGLASRAGGQQVCVVPAAGASAVDVVTVADDRVLSRERIDATGERRQSERDGCTGWETAEWSADARRVYLRSEYQCSGGVTRRTTGLIATSIHGEFLNIVGATMGGRTGVRALRHQPSIPSSRLPADIASALEGGSPGGARVAASTPIAIPEIIDASRHVDPEVVEAWLNESGQIFTTNADRLVALADAGVSDRVIDMLVALSYPKAFAIKPSPTAAGELATSDRGGSIDSGFVSGGSLLACGPYSYGLSLYGWDGCSPYGYALYGSRFGYFPYDFAYGAGGWYLATQPTIVLVRPPESTTGAHGQVVNGRGYSDGSSGSSGSTASAGSSSSGGGGASSGAGAASAGGDRTAHPR
jgi:hypothetical protein